jgi:uncharacterized protein
VQFVITAHDGKDDGAMERRMAARPHHIAFGDQLRDKGHLLYGAALLDDDERMCGSVYVVDFATRDEFDEYLAQEPYVTGEVWQDITVQRCAPGPAWQAQVQTPSTTASV